MNDPYRWEDQPAEKRVDFGEQEMHQGRGPSPLGWRVSDWLCAVLLVTCIVCAVNGWFPGAMK